jgi:LmbE family N-acetylglucosaminyl deacetylase
MIRKKEQQQAADMLGVDAVHFLDYRDGFLEYSEELRRQLVEIIKEYRPDIIFSFDPANQSFTNLNVQHRDHRILAGAVFDACFAAKNYHMYPGKAHRVDKIYFFASDKPDYYENITDLIEFKLDLLRCHKSQFPDFSKIEKYIRETISSQSDKYKYSEPFRVVEVQTIY